MKYSPAEILQILLINEDVFTLPSDNDDWSLYISSMPDGAGVKDNCGCVYDTLGVVDSRSMETGENLIHYGLQIKIRSKSYNEGWQKCETVSAYLQTVHNYNVVKGNKSYSIASVNQTTSALYIGGNDRERRDVFTINFMITIKEV